MYMGDDIVTIISSHIIITSFSLLSLAHSSSTWRRYHHAQPVEWHYPEEIVDGSTFPTNLCTMYHVEKESVDHLL